MAVGEQILLDAAKDGSLDPKEWPRVLETILSRLDHIFHNEFPRPSIPLTEPPQPLVPSTPAGGDAHSSQESQSANKENAPPSTPPSRPPVPTFASVQTATPSSPSANSHQYPPDLIALHTYIRNSLSKNFPKNPPHTIQRLAELIISPRGHYRYLPPYLHALERVIAVSSPTTIFPLPQAVLPSNVGLINGGSYTSSANNNNSLGSDESLGGALLTPIPWLRGDRSQEQDDNAQGSEFVSESTEIVDGPNGAGRIETVTVSSGMVRMGPGGTALAPRVVPSQHNPDALRDTGSVTQGELLRQEQEAGVVPVHQTQARNRVSPADEDSLEDGQSGFPITEEDEAPHARGPSEIGAEDTGPQDARALSGEFNIAAAVGRPAVEVRSPPADKPNEKVEVEMTDADAEGEPEGSAGAAGGSNETKKQKEQDTDGDFVIVDAETKAEEGQENKTAAKGE